MRGRDNIIDDTMRLCYVLYGFHDRRCNFRTSEGLGKDALAQWLSTARVDLNPHQVNVALFALSFPLSKEALLADEVGLGKKIL
jgi:hypothetical protein